MRNTQRCDLDDILFPTANMYGALNGIPSYHPVDDLEHTNRRKTMTK
jgi:hypothetical protein